MPPTRKATLEDVCKALGVSTATVSRALNNKPGVGPELRQKVLAAVRELNYVPRAAARNLSRAKTDTLGIVFQDLTAGWLLTVFRGIMSRASGGGYHVLTALSTREGDEFVLPHHLLASKRVDGLIWFDMRATHKMIRDIKKESVPVVVLQRQLADRSISTVSIENTHGAYLATRHLLELGHRRLVFITGQEDNEDSRQKRDGVEQALREYGVEVPRESFLVGHHVGMHAVPALTDYMDAGRAPPDAIFAFNDDMAIAVMNWLRNRGIRVPEDVALVGFDGIDASVTAGLTTVETPMHEMGILAVQTIIELIEDKSGERQVKHVVLNGNLVVRNSCGANLNKK